MNASPTYLRNFKMNTKEGEKIQTCKKKQKDAERRYEVHICVFFKCFHHTTFEEFIPSVKKWIRKNVIYAA